MVRYLRPISASMYKMKSFLRSFLEGRGEADNAVGSNIGAVFLMISPVAWFQPFQVSGVVPSLREGLKR